ncbi:MAG: hypothetical protein KDE29_12320 [Anaerolineales bacterium]|nr:hypothetical protein [Anaerolineales bacterium]
MTHETFFNHTLRAAISAWDRRRFVRRWRALGQQDRRWVPPYYPALLQAITPGREPFLTAANPRPFTWKPSIAAPPASPSRATRCQPSPTWKPSR